MGPGTSISRAGSYKDTSIVINTIGPVHVILDSPGNQSLRTRAAFGNFGGARATRRAVKAPPFLE